jgi:hypothetical protein
MALQVSRDHQEPLVLVTVPLRGQVMAPVILIGPGIVEGRCTEGPELSKRQSHFCESRLGELQTRPWWSIASGRCGTRDGRCPRTATPSSSFVGFAPSLSERRPSIASPPGPDVPRSPERSTRLVWHGSSVQRVTGDSPHRRASFPSSRDEPPAVDDPAWKVALPGEAATAGKQQAIKTPAAVYWKRVGVNSFR